jgi:hypothetical protein
MHAHRRLLPEVLKDEWGFDGVVVADWDGVGQLVNQGVATDLRDAAVQAIAAGVDIHMVSGPYEAHLAEFVETSQVPLDLVDEAARWKKSPTHSAVPVWVQRVNCHRSSSSVRPRNLVVSTGGSSRRTRKTLTKSLPSLYLQSYLS